MGELLWTGALMEVREMWFGVEELGMKTSENQGKKKKKCSAKRREIK